MQNHQHTQDAEPTGRSFTAEAGSGMIPEPTAPPVDPNGQYLLFLDRQMSRLIDAAANDRAAQAIHESLRRWTRERCAK